MSTLSRNTRSTANGLSRGSLNILSNKTSLTNLNNGLSKNVINSKPIKRTALSQTTNIINKNKILNGKEGENSYKSNVKVSATEYESNESKNKSYLSNNLKSKIPKVETRIKNTKKNTNELRFSSFNLPSDVENIDLYDTNNVFLATDFSNDIYIYLRYLENKLALKNNFLDTQQQMTFKMRSRLVDWIIAVHYKFKLLPETLYLTIAIMDRFLEKISIDKEKAQLVGLTSFFIACKFEEIYPPEINDFLKVCDAYSKNEILKMEKTILKTLNFVISYPLPLHFLRRFSKAAHADQEIHTLAKYLMELGLMEYECASWKPSLLAAASLYLTLHILNNKTEPQWTETLAFYTNYKEDELQTYVSTLCKILILTKDSKLQTVNKKYSCIRLLNISNSPKLECDYVFEMAEKNLQS